MTKSPLTITRHGRDVAMIVPVDLRNAIQSLAPHIVQAVNAAGEGKDTDMEVFLRSLDLEAGDDESVPTSADMDSEEERHLTHQ